MKRCKEAQSISGLVISSVKDFTECFLPEKYTRRGKK